MDRPTPPYKTPFKTHLNTYRPSLHFSRPSTPKTNPNFTVLQSPKPIDRPPVALSLSQILNLPSTPLSPLSLSIGRPPPLPLSLQITRLLSSTVPPFSSPSEALVDGALGGSCDNASLLLCIDNNTLLLCSQGASHYDHTCKEIFKGWNCITGNKSNALYLLGRRWKPSHCLLPPFDTVRFLERNKDASIALEKPNSANHSPCPKLPIV